MGLDKLYKNIDRCNREIPEYISESLRKYAENNKIKMRQSVDDTAINKLEVERGKRYRSAVTRVIGNNWDIIYRSDLSNAPYLILKTIIMHEAIHAFLAPVLNPVKDQVNVGQDTLNIINKFRQDFDLYILRNKLSFLDFEEALVQFINKMLGSDEEAAMKWIRDNCA